MNYPNRFNNNNIRVINESDVDDGLIKIENFKYDKVYFGSPTKYEKGIDLNRELFVTPFKGCASIFCLPRDPITRRDVMGIPRGNYNLNYDEWSFPDNKLIDPLDKVHIRVEGMPDIPEHEVECLGYIHEIDMSKYKDNIYIKPWMSGEDREFLIVGVNHIEFTNIIEHSITANIVGCSSNRFNVVLETTKSIADKIKQNMCENGMLGDEEQIQEGVWNDIKNGINPISDKLVFHLSSQGHLDGKIFKPRIPSYLTPYDPEEKCFENDTTSRISFSTSIEGALNGISLHMSRINPVKFDKMYVYIPEKPLKEYKHKTNKDLIKDKEVFDANVTREIWITEPVRLKLYGVIKVDQVSKISRKDCVSNINGERAERGYFSYKWHWLIKPKVINVLDYDYTPRSICQDMICELKGFKYGLPINGKIVDGSSEDYDTKYRYQSTEDFEKNGGGICYDYVEWESEWLDSYGCSYKKYYIFTDTKENDTHTFIIVDDGNGGLLYPESSFDILEGVHEVKSLKETVDMIVNKMFDYNDKKYDEIKYWVWEYEDHPPYGSNIKQCMEYFSKGEPIIEGSVKNKKKVIQEGTAINDELLKVDDYYMERDNKKIPDDLIKNKRSDITLENSTFEELENYDDSEEFSFGLDTNDFHNEYNQKDIDTLNKLIASEQSAVSEYLEAAKETNVDILSRLYSDIGDEERFHSEQLMFAKASLTGERYEPRDPAVKREYEELLSMGMDEESAMVTAIDKVGFTGSDDKDDSDIKEIQDEFEMIEESYDYVYRTIDLASVVMETSIDKHNKEMDKHFDIFVESFLYAEAMDNTAQVPKAKNPIVLILKGLAAICKFIGTMCGKFKNFVKRLQIKQKRMHEWIKANGIQGLFQQGVSLYFYSPNRGSVIDCFIAGLSALRDYGSLLFRLTDAIGKKTKCFTIQKPADIFEINHAIPFTSVEDGLEKIKNVVMTRTKIVATPTNEDELREVFFGYTPPGKKYNDKSTNIYNILDKALSEAKSLSECINKATGELSNCESNQNSIYYKNNELYQWSIKSMTQITNALNKYIKCLVSDMNQCVKLNNGILEQTHQADQDDLAAKKGNVNPKPTNPPPSR